MKNKAGNKVKLGITVSVGITLFIFGIYLIGQRQQLFSNTFRISAVFSDISGLQVGNNVRLLGINIGIVEDIQQITDSTVQVDLMINADSKRFIKKNSKALVGSDGLMGNKIVLIIPGDPGASEILHNDTIRTAQNVNIDEILFKIKVTSDNAADITNDMAAIMKNIREGKGTIGKLVMDSTLGENVDAALINIKKGAGGFKQNMDAAGQNFLLRRFIKKKEKEKEKE